MGYLSSTKASQPGKEKDKTMTLILPPSPSLAMQCKLIPRSRQMPLIYPIIIQTRSTPTLCNAMIISRQTYNIQPSSFSLFLYTGLISSRCCCRRSAGCVSTSSATGFRVETSGGGGTAHRSATFDVSEVGLSTEISGGGGGGMGHRCVVLVDGAGGS